MNSIDIKKQISPKLNLSGFKNVVPGTLFYNGKRSEKFELEVYAYDDSKYDYQLFESFEEFVQYFEQHIKGSGLICWINITGLNNIEEIRKVGQYYGISDLLLEQILTITKHSNFKTEVDFLFNDIQMVSMKENKVEIENISIFQKKLMVLTFQERKGDVFDPIRARIINKEGYIRDKDSTYLYYCLLDSLVDNYLDVLEYLKTEVEMVESGMVNDEWINVKELHELRKYIMMLKLNSAPIERFVEIYYKDNKTMNMDHTHFIDNLYEHAKLLSNEIVLQKETINVLFENYMMNNGNEMNKIMTTLTIFSAIFIPLSFLAGVYGMNFTYVPGLANDHGFYYFVIGCMVTALGMIGFFKAKRWF